MKDEALHDFSIRATFNKARTHRYLLRRRVTDATSGRTVCFVCLNPSTADEKDDDPTIRKLKYYAGTWGFDRLEVVNLFSFRTSSPEELYRQTVLGSGAGDEVTGGKRNMHEIREAAMRAIRVVCAWGGPYRPKMFGRRVEERAADVYQTIISVQRPGFVQALQLAKAGEPRHPLYLKNELHPFPFGLVYAKNHEGQSCWQWGRV
jgi:hypothetical protein